jgi:hypothetical protein
MKGVRDMGGMHGFGPVEPEANEPVFHYRREARIHALRLERNQQPECVKSTGPVALHSRPVFCVVFPLLYDPLPIPVGLLPCRSLHRLVGVSLDVADHELLRLDLLHLRAS